MWWSYYSQMLSTLTLVLWLLHSYILALWLSLLFLPWSYSTFPPAISIITHNPPLHCYFHYQTSRAIFKYPSCIWLVFLPRYHAIWTGTYVWVKLKIVQAIKWSNTLEQNCPDLLSLAEIASLPGSRTLYDSFSLFSKAHIFPVYLWGYQFKQF